MQINPEAEKPIFTQIAEGMEDAILTGAFPEESQVPSITELSVSLRVNPATALRGVNMLVEDGIVYKKRGLGMFVSAGAVERLRRKRREQFYARYVTGLLNEALRLGVSKEEIIRMIERGLSE